MLTGNCRFFFFFQCTPVNNRFPGFQHVVDYNTYRFKNETTTWEYRLQNMRLDIFNDIENYTVSHKKAVFTNENDNKIST